ncbi:hypothetical protein C8R46DRAFT_1057327 [Mycena filopes]|nr:hypothetical protein C8R46DRAFT_1057327 [Mycena filopes]
MFTSVKLILATGCALVLFGVVPGALAQPIRIGRHASRPHAFHGGHRPRQDDELHAASDRIQHIPFRNYHAESETAESRYIAATTSVNGGPQHIPFSKYPGEE